jgi:hypothetical protein
MVTYRDNTSDCKSEVSTLVTLKFILFFPLSINIWALHLYPPIITLLCGIWLKKPKNSTDVANVIVSKTWPMGWSRIETTHQIANRRYRHLWRWSLFLIFEHYICIHQSLHCCVAFDWKSPKIALTWLMCCPILDLFLQIAVYMNWPIKVESM